jgi:hypothetical protein
VFTSSHAREALLADVRRTGRRGAHEQLGTLGPQLVLIPQLEGGVARAEAVGGGGVGGEGSSVSEDDRGSKDK